MSLIYRGLEKEFKEFLKEVMNTTLEKWIEKLPTETELFGDKESKTPEEIKELYTKDVFEIYLCAKHDHWERVNQINVPKDWKILDFGAGTGQYLLKLEEKGYTNLHYYNINEIEIMFFNWLQGKRKSKIKIVEELDNDYDLIISFDVMEHLPDYPDVYTDLCNRVVKGGYFFNISQFSPGEKQGRAMHYHQFYPEKKIFEQAGFKSVNHNWWQKK